MSIADDRAPPSKPQRGDMCVVYLVISNRCQVYKLYSFNAASANNMVKYQNVIGTIIQFALDKI